MCDYKDDHDCDNDYDCHDGDHRRSASHGYSTDTHHDMHD